MAQDLRSKWHWLDHFILLLRVSWLVLSIVQYSTLYIDSPLGWYTLVWILVSFAVPLLYFRPGCVDVYRYYAAELLFTGSLYAYAVGQGEVQPLSFVGLQVMIFGYLGTKSLKSKVLGGVLFVFVIPLTSWAGHFHFPYWDMVLKLFDFVLMYGVGACFHHMVRQYGIIREKNKALEQHTRVIERLTLIEERNRMARDMHDTIGHTFISTITGLNAVKALMRVSPDEAVKNLDELLEVTRGGLQEIRQSIHQISDDDHAGSSLSERLYGVAEKFGRYTNTEIIFDAVGPEQNFSEKVALTITRILQETLTNAKRHGLAPKIEIQLFYSTKEIDLTVKDFGFGAKKLKEGFGIRAMRERVSSLQGTLRIHSQPGAGTTMQCKIPLLGDM